MRRNTFTALPLITASQGIIPTPPQAWWVGIPGGIAPEDYAQSVRENWVPRGGK